MALDPIDLIRRFEPILYFHGDERFFPSDAKRYLEHCALWRVQGPPFDNSARWGGTSSKTFPHFPMIPRGKLVAIAGERPVVSEASDGVKAVFLGSAPFTSDTADEERFLDPVGWVGGARVDADTANRYADLDRIFNAYQGDVPALAESRFWYHAEVFTATRLRGLLAPPQPDGNFQKFLKLTDPALVCYYLFFPGHVEPLEGCPDSDLAKRWASCAGAWGCVAVLLDGDTSQSKYKPTMIGLTTRNAGSIQFLGQELRVGMRVFDWNKGTPVTQDHGPGRESGVHPRVFVSLGAHGLTLNQTAPPSLTMFSPKDYTDDSCGAYETHAGLSKSDESLAADRSEHDKLALAKIIAGAVGGFHAMGGFLGPGLVGASGGAVAGAMDALIEYGGMARFAGLRDPQQTAPPQFDHPPVPGQIGTVIHPVGVEPPDAPADRRQVWPRFNTSDPNDDKTLFVNDHAGRLYSLWVANSGAPDSRPVWLPSEDTSSGVASFKGRWGNRVISDPFNRRVGMRFPEFWPMFFDGIGK